MKENIVDNRVIRRRIPVDEKILIVEASFEPGAMVSERWHVIIMLVAVH